GSSECESARVERIGRAHCDGVPVAWKVKAMDRVCANPRSVLPIQNHAGRKLSASAPQKSLKNNLLVADFPVALVALSRLRLGLRVSLLILTQRAADIVRFLEFPFFIAANKPLVAFVRLDELSF